MTVRQKIKRSVELLYNSACYAKAVQIVFSSHSETHHPKHQQATETAMTNLARLMREEQRKFFHNVAVLGAFEPLELF